MSITPERRSEIARMGGRARARNFTREHQSRASRAQSSDVKRRGWIAACAKYGADTIRALAADKRRANPSPGEARFAHILDSFGTPYQREVCIGGYYFDFVVPRRGRQDLVIEIDGGNWHNAAASRSADEKKETIARVAGYDLIRVRADRIDRAAVSRLIYGNSQGRYPLCRKGK